MYSGSQGLLPGPLKRYVLHFESRIREEVEGFAASLPEGARVLDAGAGELQYAELFQRQRYTAVDLGVGDSTWNYGKLDAVADLSALPFGGGTFDGAINIVTLEHVKEPRAVMQEMGRVLKPGASLLLVVPTEWEEHQQPHDYFRYTQFGVRYLAECAGLEVTRLEPVGGFFRLLARRMLNSLQFFPGPVMILAAFWMAPAALLLPLLEPLDRRRNFTLGYVCIARRKS